MKKPYLDSINNTSEEEIFITTYYKGYCMNIGEYCLSQCIILHSHTREIRYTARDNIHQYSCNNPILLGQYFLQIINIRIIEFSPP